MDSSIHAHTPPKPKSSPGWMITIAAAAAFLATFNETFLNVAFAPIMADFGVDVNTVQWLTTGYLLVAAIFVPVANVLYRRFPTKALFISVTGIMVVGSIIGALAPNFATLLGGRLLQAIGTGLLTPIGMNITLAVSPRHKLGMNMGIMAAMTTLGPSLAIVLSGALLTIAPWKTLMWVFAALVLIVLIAGAFVLYTVVELGRPVLDIASFILVAVALIGILYGVSAAFGGNIVISGGAIIVGLLFLWAFIRRQNRIANPLIDLTPFKTAAFNRGVAMTMLGLLFVFAMNVTIPLFLQAARGTAPLSSSLTLAPGILLTVVLGPIAGRWFDRFGGRFSIPLGFAVMAIFVGLVGLAAGQTSLVLFGALYVPAVLATAFVIGPSQTFALSHLDERSSPHGVTVISTSFQIAGGVGTSLAAGIYGMVSQMQLDAGQAEVDSLITGFRAAAILVIVTSVIGIIIAIRAYAARKPLDQPAETSAPQSAIAGIMKTDVYTLQSSDTVLEALYKFTSLGISGAPIVDQNSQLVGFISDGDIMRYLSAAHPSSVNFYSFAVHEKQELDDAMQELSTLNIMQLATKQVISLSDTASLADAIAALSDAHLKKVPVTNRDGSMVGIISRSAINRLAIANYLETEHQAQLVV